MQGSSKSSGLLAAGTTALTGTTPCKSYVGGVLLVTDGTNAATVTVYDNANSATGDVLAKLTLAGAQNSVYMPIQPSVRADLGLTVVVTGTGAGAVIHYGA